MRKYCGIACRRLGQRPAPDPLRALAALGGDQRQQRETDDGERRRPRRAPRAAGLARSAATAPSAPAGTRRSSASTAPAHRQARRRPCVAGSARRSSPHEAQHRQRAHEHEQPVCARLLRVPHEQRVDCDERRADQRGAATGELLADRPDDGHGEDAGERRGQPQGQRAVAEQSRVGPGEQVPQRRRVLGWTTARSVAPRPLCRTCTGVKASSYQKLCWSSVTRRSTAASTISAASGHHWGIRRALATAGGGAAATAFTVRTPAAALAGRSSRSGKFAGCRSAAAGTSRRARCAGH